jgi:hypothetical protein
MLRHADVCWRAAALLLALCLAVLCVAGVAGVAGVAVGTPLTLEARPVALAPL